MRLHEILKAKAHSLGFALVGITTADPPPHWPVFQDWLKLGRHGSMRYLEDPRRADPRLVMPGCQSIVALGIRIANPAVTGTLPERPALTGRVAAYAWGRDYHTALPERLRELGETIDQEAGERVAKRWFTDSGPLLERDLAQRAGLGWIGKNSCLINPEIGSAFLLAEMLLGVELEPDPPFTADRCGTCRRCIEACPTGCILPDRTLDARRCLSTLTIENKGEIPAELRASLGDRVFGCDTCQEVCPWNRKATSAPDPAFEPKEGMPFPDLRVETRLTAEEFNRKYQDSPLQRAKRRGYRRNACTALGNSREAEALATLEEAAADEDPLIGEHARWAIAQLKAGW